MNKMLLLFLFTTISLSINARPFAEYEHVNFLFMGTPSSNDEYSLQEKIISNLSPDIEINLYYQYFPSFDFEEYPNVSYFRYDLMGTWARDILPYAVKTKNKWTFVWPYSANPGDFASKFNRPLVFSNSYISGGNILSDRKGNCFTINDNPQFIEETMKKNYGCSTVTIFPKVAGIGHIDERMKIISDTTILLDEPSYKNRLSLMGYNVVLLPRPNFPFGNYANAMLINGTVFLPTYRENSDVESIQIYESFGFIVIPLDSKNLSKNRGSIHCMTMTYP